MHFICPKAFGACNGKCDLYVHNKNGQRDIKHSKMFYAETVGGVVVEHKQTEKTKQNILKKNLKNNPKNNLKKNLKIANDLAARKRIAAEQAGAQGLERLLSESDLTARYGQMKALVDDIRHKLPRATFGISSYFVDTEGKGRPTLAQNIKAAMDEVKSGWVMGRGGSTPLVLDKTTNKAVANKLYTAIDDGGLGASLLVFEHFTTNNPESIFPLEPRLQNHLRDQGLVEGQRLQVHSKSHSQPTDDQLGRYFGVVVVILPCGLPDSFKVKDAKQEQTYRARTAGMQTVSASAAEDRIVAAVSHLVIIT
jgi:hypothetical protein